MIPIKTSMAAMGKKSHKTDTVEGRMEQLETVVTGLRQDFEAFKKTSGKKRGAAKGTRAPTEYNLYMKHELPIYKAKHLGVNHQEAFKAVAAQWTAAKGGKSAPKKKVKKPVSSDSDSDSEPELPKKGGKSAPKKKVKKPVSSDSEPELSKKGKKLVVSDTESDSESEPEPPKKGKKPEKKKVDSEPEKKAIKKVESGSESDSEPPKKGKKPTKKVEPVDSESESEPEPSKGKKPTKK